MRRLLAALAVALLGAALAAEAAPADPAELLVRVEGRAETLFEGPILTAPHKVRAASDPSWRQCNGLDPGAPGEPAPVPTAAASDAMRIVNESFDGLWYPSYADYFITRWGPDAEDPASSAYWGLVVNNVFSSLGGCRHGLDDGDEVLWVYDAFSGHERLVLYPAEYAEGSSPPAWSVELGQPLEVEVDTWSGGEEGGPPGSPARSTDPYAGATVAPVVTSPNGFQQVDLASPEAVLSGADGRATLEFGEPGWQRIKATATDGEGEETVVRSNRLDVCVFEPPDDGCGAPPADAQVRTPPPPLPGELEGGGGDGPPPGGGGPATTPPPALAPVGAAAPRLRVALRRLDRRSIRRGIVRVRWRLRDPGVGVRRWSVQVRQLGRRRGRFVSRARGRRRQWARIRLRKGGRYRLRIVFVDRLGRRSAAQLGTVRVPG